MNTIHTLLLLTVFLLGVIGFYRPSWPVLGLAVILLSTDGLIRLLQ